MEAVSEHFVHRALRSQFSPVGIRCKLCRLDVDEDNSANQLTIEYCDHAYLTRRVWLCESCIRVIAEFTP